MSRRDRYNTFMTHSGKFQPSYGQDTYRQNRHYQEGRVSVTERNTINNGIMNDFDKHFLTQKLKSGDDAHLAKDYLKEANDHREAQEHLHNIRGFEKKTKDCNEAYAWNSAHHHHPGTYKAFEQHGKCFTDYLYYDGCRYNFTKEGYDFAQQHGMSFFRNGQRSIVSDVSLGKVPFSPYTYTNSSGNQIRSNQQTNQSGGSINRSGYDMRQSDNYKGHYIEQTQNGQINTYNYANQQIAGNVGSLQSTYTPPPTRTSTGKAINQHGFYLGSSGEMLHYQTHKPYDFSKPSNAQGYAVNPNDLVVYPL